MSARYKRITVKKWQRDVWIMVSSMILFMLVMATFKHNLLNDHAFIISPIPEDNKETRITITRTKVKVVEKVPENLDTWVDRYSEEYTDNPYAKSIMKAKLHFLLSKETHHCENKGSGDNGLALGCLQFHASTYKGYRRIMIERGLVDEIGSWDNPEQAIETAAWAISDGRENAWGPIMRGEIKI